MSIQANNKTPIGETMTLNHASAERLETSGISETRLDGWLRPIVVTSCVVAIALLISAPLIFPSTIVLVLGSALVLGMFSLSLNILFGTSGLLTFGHAAYFGIGAYTVALLVSRLEWNPLAGLIVAPLAAAVAASILAPIVLRGKEIYFGLLTLGTAQLVYAIAHGTPAWTGGDEGLIGDFQPSWAFDLSKLYWFTFACVAGGALVLWMVTRSPFGDALRGLRENRLRAQFIGISPIRYEYGAFIIAAFFAGLAGGLFTIYEGQVQDALFFWQMSATPLIVALLGGFGYFLGPVVGAIFYTLLTDQLASRTEFWDVAVGLVVVVVAIGMPSGIIGALESGLRNILGNSRPRVPQRATVMSAAPAASSHQKTRADVTTAPVLLEVSNLTKSFGGLHVTRDVSMKVRKGTIHAIIGPNGAGKTTFFNLITGALRPDAGKVQFAGKDITFANPWDRVKLGLGRSFQQPNIFPALATIDNVALAEASVRGRTARLVGKLPAAIRDRAAAILKNVGLGDVALVRAADLSHGDQRTLEIAMGLAVEAQLLCLDEPTAGVGPGETRQVVNAIREIAQSQGLTILFVEHDMDVVFGIADRITVLCNGSVLAEGTPDEIRRNPDVIAAYLGADTAGDQQ